MYKKIGFFAAIIICRGMPLAAATIQFFNKVEPQQYIWVKIEPRHTAAVACIDASGFKKIGYSGIADPCVPIFRSTGTLLLTGNSIKTVVWKYEENGTEYREDIDWGFWGTGQAHIFNDSIVIMRTADLLHKITHQFIFDSVNRGKELFEKGRSLITESGQFLAGPIKELIKKDQPAIVGNPYKTTVASVRHGSPIGNEEFAFRQARLPLVKTAQEKFMGSNFTGLPGPAPEEPLEIAFVFSGGGLRAMYSTLGALTALQLLGLMDTAMTITTLSGSTWALFPWLLGDPATKGEPLPVKKFLESMGTRFEDGLLLTYDKGGQPAKTIEHFKELSYITDMLLVKFAFDQPVNPVIDLYGALLANKLLSQFGDKRQRAHISDIALTLKKGKLPLPVGTAKLENIENWMEVTPFEVGTRWTTDLSGNNGSYVPTWAFGRKFAHGKSVDFAPEQSAGFYLGMFGSAIAVSGRELYHGMIKSMKIADYVKQVFKQTIDTELGTIRLVWAEAYNPFSHEGMKLVDAGVDFLCPVFASYRKTEPSTATLIHGGAPDIIFIFDNSARILSDELYKHAAYARKHNLKYPLDPERDFVAQGENWVLKDSVKQESVAHRAMTLFEGENDEPTVVYIPRVVDTTIDYAAFDPSNTYRISEMKMTAQETEPEYGTFNLKYSVFQAERLAKLAEFNVRALAKEFKEVIKNKRASKGS